MRVKSVILTGSAIVSLIFILPTTASASITGRPTGCTAEVSGDKMTVARCGSSNGGHYRAVAVCKDPDTGDIKLFDGDWRNNGSFSKAYCQGATRVQSAGFETKVT